MFVVHFLTLPRLSIGLGYTVGSLFERVTLALEDVAPPRTRTCFLVMRRLAFLLSRVIATNKCRAAGNSCNDQHHGQQ